MQSKLDYALNLITRGFYVFPLAPDVKVPRQGESWPVVSTLDLDTAERWFADNRFNIGIDTGKSGLYVIDVDVKPNKDGTPKTGDKSFAELDIFCGFDKTLVFKTPTGGLHYVYKGTGLGNTASALGKDLDTRGEGGYIVAPGSVVAEGQYTIEHEHEIAPLQEWIRERLDTYKTKERSQRKEVFASDNEVDILRAKDWLINTAEIAVEGAAGDHTTYATAAKLREFGCSKETTLDLMLDHWNERCSPPWGYEELEKKVANAYSYAQKPQGAASALVDFQPVVVQPQGLLEPLPDGVATSDIPRRDWVFGDLALRKKISVLTASPGSGKSTLTILLALAKATGRDIAGMEPHGQGAVALWNNEDDKEELYRRTKAAMQHHNIKPEDIKDKNGKSLLMINSGENRPLRMAKKAGPSNLIVPEDAELMIAELKANNVELFIVDPLSETHPANENDNGEMLAVMGIYRHVAQQANCAVMVVHHDRKPPQADSSGHAGNMYAARGASSIAGAARVMVTLYTMTAADARLYGVDKEARHLYARLDMAKANLSLNSGKPRWFKRTSVNVGGSPDDFDSGESVGVLEPVTLTAIEREENDDRLSYDALALYDVLAEYRNTILDRRQIKKRFDEKVSHRGSQTTRARSERFRRALLELQGHGHVKEFSEREIILPESTAHMTPQNSTDVDTPQTPQPPRAPLGAREEDVDGVRMGL